MWQLFIGLVLLAGSTYSAPHGVHVAAAGAMDGLQIVEIGHNGQQMLRHTGHRVKVAATHSADALVELNGLHPDVPASAERDIKDQAKVAAKQPAEHFEESNGLHQDVPVGAERDIKDLLEEPDCPTMFSSLFSSSRPPREALWLLKHQQMMPLDIADNLLDLERDDSTSLDGDKSRQNAGEWVLFASDRCSAPLVCRAISDKLLKAGESECPRGRLLHQVQKQLEAHWRHSLSPAGESLAASMSMNSSDSAKLTAAQFAIAHWGMSLLQEHGPTTIGNGIQFLVPLLVPALEDGQKETPLSPLLQLRSLVDAAGNRNVNLLPIARPFLLAAENRSRHHSRWNPSILLMRLLLEQRQTTSPQELMRDAAVVSFHETRVAALEHEVSKEPKLSDALQRRVHEMSSQLKRLMEDHASALPDDMGVLPAFWYGRVARLQRQLDSRRAGSSSVKPTVLIWTCSYGGGHRAATKALQGYLGRDYNNVVVDPSVDPEFFEGDTTGNFLRDYVSPLFNSTYFFNEVVLKDKRYDFENGMETYQVLRNLLWQNRTTRFSQPCPAPVCDSRQKKLMRRAMLRTAPDAIITVYHMDLLQILELAQEMGGVPLMHLATDIDAKMWEVFAEDPKYPDLRIGAPFDLPQAFETAKPLPRKRLFVSGYPVRPSFLSPVPSAEKRDSLRRFRGIHANTTVVLVMSGSSGQAVPWPMMLADSKSWTEPLHVVVVAGKNTDYAAELEDRFDKKDLVAGRRILRNSANPTFSLEVASDPIVLGAGDKPKDFFVSESELVSLMDLSDVLVSKAGGSTCAEAAYRGVPMLFDATDGMLHWEAFTAHVFDQHSRGRILLSPSDLETALHEVIRLGRNISLAYSNGRLANASANIREELVEMHKRARRSRTAVQVMRRVSVPGSRRSAMGSSERLAADEVEF